MNIILVYKEDYPWDVRVEKIAATLQSSGHNVTILARNRSGDKRCEQVAGLNVVRLPRLTALPKPVRFLVNLPFFLNPFWLATIYFNAKRLQTDLIIVRDLPLVGAALLIGRVLGTKTICDMAECYPLMYRSIQKHSKQNKLDTLLKNPARTLRYEKRVLPACDHVWAMIEESRDRLINELKLHPDRVSIVSNTPVGKLDSPTVYHTDHAIRIVYVGFLSRLRGLDLLLEAVSTLKAEAPEITISVDIIGKGKEKQQLIDQCNKLGLNSIVNIHGWLEKADVDRLMDQANVGILTYRVCEHWNHTIPNKIFDYMAAELPVIATPVRPIKRILEDTQSGVVAESEEPAAIARCLRELVDPAMRQVYGHNGYQAVKQRFNWTKDAEVMISDIDRLG